MLRNKSAAATARVAVLASLLGLVAGAADARGEVHAVDITLFMPCDHETAVAAAESLRTIPGVTDVDLVAGKLAVRVETGPDFTRDPLEIVQKLWDGKIYPNKIHLEASGHFRETEQGLIFQVEGTGQQFRISDEHDPRGRIGRLEAGAPLYIRAEVVDWVEDRIPEPGELYSLRLFDSSTS